MCLQAILRDLPRDALLLDLQRDALGLRGLGVEFSLGFRVCGPRFKIEWYLKAV
jgi:hypothetical protein